MITPEESIPRRTPRYLEAQDIIWSQFNDINFYVEDIDQENFYYNILKKLFPETTIKRIFPLGGKKKVINKANKSKNMRNRVFILDMDFDEILSRQENNSNIFYLRRYSIENYLFTNQVLCEFIREYEPKLTYKEYKDRFNLEDFLTSCSSMLIDLSSSFLIIQKYNLGIDYHKINPARDCDYSSNPCCLHTKFLTPYFNNIELALKNKNKSFKLSTQISKSRKFFRKKNLFLKNTPGKYILNILKHKLERTFSLPNISIDSFAYRLAKISNFDELVFLKNNIESYIKEL